MRARDRYQRSAPHGTACIKLLGELDGEAPGREPGEVARNLDAPDDPLPGQQNGRF